MSEIFNFEKSPIEELRDLLPGTDGFDFGTSPHGLAAELHQTEQETPEVSSCHPPAKPLLTSPAIYRNAELLESCRIIEAAAAKRTSGFFGLTLTQEQCSHLAFAVLEQIESLEESYEADEPEVKDALRCLLEVQRMMKRAATKHAYKTGQAKGGSTWRKDGDSLFVHSYFTQRDQLFHSIVTAV